MGVTDQALEANRRYSGGFKLGDLPMPPGKHLAVLACMDARLTVEQVLGLNTGDAHVIRNAGGIASEDAIRSLIISHHLLGTREFMVINHTDCGMLTFRDEDLRARLKRATGTAVVAPAHFFAFDDVEANVRELVQKIRSHPWIPDSTPVRGFVYDVKTGVLNEVSVEPAARPR
jgi:carbonic anhydrase